MKSDTFIKLNQLGFQHNVKETDILKEILLFLETKGFFIDRITHCSSNEILGFDMVITGWAIKTPIIIKTNDYKEGYIKCINYILNEVESKITKIK